MKFDTPATVNPIDNLRVIGQATSRIDGSLKTTGKATYGYEWHGVFSAPAYGWVIGAAIAKGRIASMDLSRAHAVSGVIAIVTAENAGALDKGKYNTAKLLGGPQIDHYHQAVAVVVAETFEQARSAAELVRIDYEEGAGAFDLAASWDDAKLAPKSEDSKPDSAAGDFAGAFAAAPVQLDATYTTPDQAHAMMEPHASIAAWEGDKLTLWTSNQMVAWTTADLAKTLGISKENVHLLSPYIGGGFGGKLFLRADAVLAALGSRASGRPVKVALQRPLMFNNTTHRPATIQRIRIGADSDGKISAIGHESWSGNLPEGRPETAVQQTRLLYAGVNRMTTMRLAMLDLPEGNAMRAPGEAPGMMALEIAMDEMAERLKMDPVEFRIRNDTQVDPENPKRPFSQRQLVECMRIGRERFGWDTRGTRPGEKRDGRWLVGVGMAAAFRNNLLMKSAARVRLDSRGIVTVETDMTDIGTGSYTIIAQTAAEMMGVPLDKVVVRLGDSAYPVSSGSGGQFGANNSTSGVYAACVKLRDAVAQKLGFNSAEVQFADERVVSGNRAAPLAHVASNGDITAEDFIEYGDLSKTHQQSTFGAHFVEVAVDAATAEIRVRRMLAVCAAGRILNPKTARSQVIGAMTMGVGAALMEELAVDKRKGFFVNHDLAGYEVPVHADIPHQDVIFLDEADPMSSPMKAKGVGELGICGVAAAVANAAYNATGVRVRDYPVTLDKLLDRMPKIG
ncbi:aldehyde oxidoreductase molybdenum-binding subunit PaoC [Bradyrhizobium japonicum]|jgi:xanthine dehydrogenase YagR molybdenum-binding subunit|uniref:Xanthine dehydrogenase YagR molybdenum-binding subunit n=1 Tax=Bradyrhizobium japonicum TaxID=375 RepID=A0ABV2RMX0_BRAJP|nr:aldehyde oxidoreductase molybdenum-binding subunit PaoC [Bradyrhizobium japonicum]MCP1762362.1 xanthine dehydrogenase YagR molybdenum-binding subunit [Bradyrhizobium japonicum]MCP1793942.1 xanthine dehydrogenase YagR molybdenum-binding subunit [Bradyrhizobium japonicum]MCP1806375.1 xanthine dehydrogenase YagR molybdenum-binding subunit [Bradyrhizobium japonicum]MCP1815303.1 xanthine dehydrogenase YagR molybdenum-binding subunit [Bradyrhizobium japonicum]MCP1873180.1 xanthine dehydrogenase Y